MAGDTRDRGNSLDDLVLEATEIRSPLDGLTNEQKDQLLGECKRIEREGKAEHDGSELFKKAEEMIQTYRNDRQSAREKLLTRGLIGYSAAIVVAGVGFITAYSVYGSATTGVFAVSTAIILATKYFELRSTKAMERRLLPLKREIWRLQEQPEYQQAAVRLEVLRLITATVESQKINPIQRLFYRFSRQ